MSAETVRIKYTGTALPGNAETVSIFDTTLTGISNFVAISRLHRLYLTIVNDQAGTLVSQSSENGGTTWTTISSTAVAASAANSENPYDYLIEPYRDWRVRWTNGATPQGSFRVAAALVGERSPGA
jgi:hypothetical protein